MGRHAANSSPQARQQDAQQRAEAFDRQHAESRARAASRPERTLADSVTAAVEARRP
ncbi:hypothetical protein [Streptomyces sp. Z26]|uniref:hypothetical protein n=1 Tax=Streptomyces sp. Z26 TaxID=2500177 RepID=UPI0014051180|nr:hypothetical protein [Streptomyces sp. Z26]